MHVDREHRAGSGIAAASSTARRRRDIDHLRSLIILGLIAFHTARLFDSDPWHIKDAGRYLAADVLVGVFNLFQMPLLFLLAGMTLKLSLDTRGAGEAARERVVRLLVPFLAGLAIVVPPQVYAERIAIGSAGRMSPIDFDGSFLAFYPQFLSCCYPAANFSWHHLWFVIYLFVYSLLLIALLAAVGPARAADSVRHWARRMPPAVTLALLATPILVVELLLRRRFPGTHALIDDHANHAHFLMLMLIGWLFAVCPELTEPARRRWRGLLGAAAALVVVIVTIRTTQAPIGVEARLALRVAAEWCAILAALGLARSRLDVPIRGLDAFGRLSFPFYVFHQTLIVLLGYVLLDWSSTPALKFLAIAAIALAGSLVLARLAGMTRASRLIFGMRA
ncbi:MAG: acyltransferase [Alphaproteobacteria bacterium]|nr:acyltransferase [Alphaproteobacteria bacterium]